MERNLFDAECPHEFLSYHSLAFKYPVALQGFERLPVVIGLLQDTACCQWLLNGLVIGCESGVCAAHEVVDSFEESGYL